MKALLKIRLESDGELGTVITEDNLHARDLEAVRTGPRDDRARRMLGSICHFSVNRHDYKHPFQVCTIDDLSLHETNRN